MHRYYILEGIFILLGFALVVTAIKYPKDVFVKLPLEIIKVPFRQVWWLISLPLTILTIPLIYLGEKYKWRMAPTMQKLLDLGGSDDDDKPHPSTRNLKVDFTKGDKYVFVLTASKDLKQLINDFLEALTGKHSIEEFEIADNGERKIVRVPGNINFYDYHLILQHLSTGLGDKKCFGVYKSDKLNYYVFQDTETLNNLVGFTSDKQLFSIYMLDDLETKQHLRINQKLKVDAEWVERLIEI